MRPGQQNKRGRGRGNNNNNGGGGNNNFNRKGGNPLSRTYDSSGPDVKIRGTAQHIAEKYSALARDAQSAGDRVMAENYLQHAEHYNRIIAAAQAQMQDRFHREDRGDYQDRDAGILDQDEIETADADDLSFAQQPMVDEAPQQQQPRREQREQNTQGQDQQPPRENRRDREQRRDRRQDRPDRQERREREQPAAAAEQQPAAPVVDDGSGPQPVIEGTPAEVVVEQAEQAEAAAPAERTPRRRAASRPRRPRRGEGAEEGEASGDDAQPALAQAAGE